MSTTDQQYYTPSIEELHVGYQYEVYVKGAGWTPTIIEDFRDMELGPTNADLDWDDRRTPYLTKEQIQAEGWNLRMPGDNYLSLLLIKPEGLRTIAVNLKDDHRIEIYTEFTDDRANLFNGYCPSINEFRRITKLVGIEKKDAVNS